MKQRIADVLQVIGAAGLTVAAGTVSLALALLVGSLLVIVAGLVVERS